MAELFIVLRHNIFIEFSFTKGSSREVDCYILGRASGDARYMGL